MGELDQSRLTALIARRKRQDFLFNLLGIFCTMVGIIVLSALLIDLVIDSLGLRKHYHKDFEKVPPDAYRVEAKHTKTGILLGGELTLTLDGRSFTTELSRAQTRLLQQTKPDKVELYGPQVVIPLRDKDNQKQDVLLEISEEDREYLTRDVSEVRKTFQVAGTFMTSFPGPDAPQAGILSAWVGSLLVMLVTASLAVPLGVAAGVYLEEYARKNWLTALIEINISNLAGVPSILYGLMALGLLLYEVNLDRMNLGGTETSGWPVGPKGSIAAAGVTLALLILPIVIVATREALRSIPLAIREAAYALGATKWQVVRHHLLPYSAGGIATGVIIGLSRAIGETAPLVTIGALTFIAFLPEPWYEFLTSPFTVLPIQMYNWVSRPSADFRTNAAAAGVVLMAMTLGLNGGAIWLRYRLRRSIKW